MKLPAQNAKRAERTDLEMLAAWRRLSPDRQAHYARAILDEAADLQDVLPLHELLQHPRVLQEARALSRAVGIRLTEFAEVIDPGSYSSCTARSFMATMTKMARVETDGPAEVLIDVKVHEAIHLRHNLIGGEFSVHVVFGPVTLIRGGESRTYQTKGVLTIPDGEGELLIHAQPGAWFKYVPHPLSAWIAAQKGT